jgi:hypothetical protein
MDVATSFADNQSQRWPPRFEVAGAEDFSEQFYD